jgi:hypothetical protein
MVLLKCLSIGKKNTLCPITLSPIIIKGSLEFETKTWAYTQQNKKKEVKNWFFFMVRKKN